MNNVSLVGRLARDPEIRQTSNDSSVAKFTVAVNRRIKDANGEYGSDFISCTAFGKTAEVVANYFKKGSPIGVTGRIQTGSYTNNNGQKVYTTDIIADNIEFVASKAETSAMNNGNNNSYNNSQQNANYNARQQRQQSNDYMNIPDGVDELPFN